MQVKATDGTSKNPLYESTPTSESFGRRDTMCGGTHPTVHGALDRSMHRSAHSSRAMHGSVHGAALASVDIFNVPQSSKNEARVCV